MDFVDLILLLVFVGFPLLQFVLEKLGKGQQPPPPPAEFEWEPEEEERPPLPRQQVPTLPSGFPDLSEGADAWTAESLETLASEEVVSEREANELIAMQRRAASLQIPEATRVHVPVVSLESLHVDRKAEHSRFHSRVAAPPPRPPAPVLRPAIYSASDLRKAIILSELLGPPVSMR